MTTTKRQTAGNNWALNAIKAAMNVPIFKESSRLMNEQGPEAVRDYLRLYFREEAWGVVDKMMAGVNPYRPID